MARDLVIGIDLGTTQVKVGLFDATGDLVALAREGYPLLTERGPGWVEQDPRHWWHAVCAALRQVVPSAQGQIAGVCCGGQGPTLVVVDETGQPICHAITWMDTRARAEEADLAERLRGSGRWSNLAKALWLKRHHPDLYARTRWFLSAYDYIAYRLSGRPAESVMWGREPVAADAFHQVGLDPARFPPSVTAGTVAGEVTSAAAADTALPGGVPVVSGINDGMATFLGAGLVEPGLAIDAGGTSGGFGLCWDAPLTAPGLGGGDGLLPGLFVFGGPMATTGKALDWFRDSVIADGASTEDLLDTAAQAPPGADGLLFLPYLAGERAPHWDASARGVLVGLTLRHGRGHLVRAILEGAAFALRDVAQRTIESGGRVTEMRVAGGPARSGLWNQIKADITGFRVGVPRVTEVAVLGAAMLAGMAGGMFPGIGEGVARMVHIDRTVEPRGEHRQLYEAMFQAYRQTYVQLVPVFRQLTTVGRADHE